MVTKEKIRKFAKVNGLNSFDCAYRFYELKCQENELLRRELLWEKN